MPCYYENKHDVVNEFHRRKKSLGRTERTLKEYSRVLRWFYHDHFPDLTPGETQVYHIEEYLYSLGEKELEQNSKRRYLESLSAFFSWAMKRPRFEDINGNPAAVVLEEVPKQIKDRPDCATWENACKIVRQIHDPRDKAVAAIMAKTGSRVSEPLAVRYDDLMLDEGFIRLRERKGGKQTVIPVDDEIRRIVQQVKFVNDSDGNGDEYVFKSIRGNKLDRERLRRVVKKAAYQTGVTEYENESRFHKKFTPHTFRTVFTTLMRNEGMKDHILQYIRGDDSNKKTMDIYTRVDRDEARKEYLEYIKPLEI
jgi:integrase/recombinase XerD